ncbi:MAG: S9 family peptidase [Lachnospiraceae bacterium]|nr:S9 family peptidase [Lachnospiraceae bacterium]
MRSIEIDDFCKMKFLSNVTFSPEGGSACYVVTQIDKKKDAYVSHLYVRRGGEEFQLTTFGEEKSFQYLDEETILFRGKREEEKNPLISRFYTISLGGGEAKLAYTFPIPVSEILPLAGGNLLVVGQTIPGFEELYLGDPKYLATYEKHVKENADYEEVTQVPWWHNGGTFTKGSYRSLFFYDAKKKRLRRLTELGEQVFDVCVNEDKTRAYYLSMQAKPLVNIWTDKTLKCLTFADETVREIAKDGADFVMHGMACGEHFLMLLAADNRFGINTDVDFYQVDYVTNEVAFYAHHCEAIGTSVGSDARYGGGRSFKMVGDTCYFISTRFDGAYLFKISDGEITQLTHKDGSVDCFDVCGDQILMIAFYDMRGQELYDGRGKRLTSHNVAALRGKYVAQPERCDLVREDENGTPYEIHGFVLYPKDYDPVKKYPVILDIHGGPKTVYGPVFYHEMQYWASKGYFVIFCNPTGSDGRGAFMDIRGKYGSVDYEDIMAFCDTALAKYPQMDADNFFETGGSYGGFMTNWIIGHTDRFKACASQRSISNWFSMFGVSDIGVRFTEDQNLSSPWENPEKLWSHSPMKYADKAKTPTLFIHSFEDYRCPIDQGYQMYTSLIAHGVEAKMVLFKGENHELSRSGKPSHRVKRLKEITAWFEGHKG